MAGFLDKKKRLIDYKLSEAGREKLSTGNLDFAYYTFSDRSIVYSQNLTGSNASIKSDSLESFLPFEADSHFRIKLNPDFSLSSTLAFESEIITKLLETKDNFKKTLSEKIIEFQFLDNVTVDNKIDRDDNIFSFKNVFEEYDFKNSLFVERYPTIKQGSESLKSLPNIGNEDKRFKHFLTNKKLVPVSSDNFPFEIPDELEDIADINLIFKNLEIESLNLEGILNREELIVKVLNGLKTSNNISKLEYEIHEDYAKDSDQYLFELHNVIYDKPSSDLSRKATKLKKLFFINLGNFIDNVYQTEYTVYLIGKILKKTSTTSEEGLYQANNITVAEFDDYAFINLFTLVVE